MESLLTGIDSQTMLIVGAIAIALLLVKLAVRVINVGLGLIVTIVAIALVLQYAFGITPKALWLELVHLPQELIHFVKNLG